MSTSTKYIIEIATTDFYTTKLAVEAGADRVEVCANLAEGGVTPSYGQLKKCREEFVIPLWPMIRPRGGDFLYSDEEFDTMIADTNLCRELGYEGIVTGLLNRDGSIDRQRMSLLVEAAYPMGVTCHRAFDRCRDPFEALEQLMEIGCERILTSGQQPSAPDAVELIAGLNKAAAERITIMPGSGVKKENIRMLAEKTGCTEFHTSLRVKEESKMEFIHPAFAGSQESYYNNSINAAEIDVLKKYLTD